MSHMEVNGTRIHYRIDGPAGGAVVVLSNSLGTDLRMWDAQVAALAPRFRVLRYDSRGQGASGVPEGPYELEDLGRDLLGLLDGLDIARAHVCGVSMGGLVALWLAAHHPGRLESAVYANTAAKIGTDELWEARMETVRAEGMRGVRDGVLARFFTSSFDDRDAIDRVAEMLESTSPQGYLALCSAVRAADLRGEVGDIDVPSLILTADQDRATPPSDAAWLHEHIRNSRLVVIDGAAHLSNVECSARFNEALLDHLAGVRGS